MKKDIEKGEPQVDPNTASSKKLIGRAERSSKKSKSIVRDNGEKESSTKASNVKEKNLKEPEKSLKVIKKPHLESSKGNTVSF